MSISDRMKSQSFREWRHEVGRTGITKDQLTICVTFDGVEHYPVCGNANDMNLLREVVINTIITLGIKVSKAHGHLEFKK